MMLVGLMRQTTSPRLCANQEMGMSVGNGCIDANGQKSSGRDNRHAVISQCEVFAIQRKYLAGLASNCSSSAMAAWDTLDSAAAV